MSAEHVFVVQGGSRLSGTIRVPGAKNSALKLLAASILTDAKVVLQDVPGIADVPVMIDLLRSIGTEVTHEGATVTLQTSADPDVRPDADKMTRIRASISLLGPLVGRLGEARLALPGGDRIGKRSIDLHLDGLRQMGAEVTQTDDEVHVRADRLHGARITLEFPSVGATENLIMAAVRADGVTVIDNAAREPEIQDLCRMLVGMGATIDGVGSATVTVQGTRDLSGITWTVVPDRIEVGTWIVAAALAGDEVVIDNVRAGDLTMPLTKFRAAGVDLDEEPDRLVVRGSTIHPTNVVTLPYPGFPTDMQPQMMVLLTQARGASRCTENVFESRFAFVDELRKMGADVKIDGHHAIIRGRTALHGATLNGLDVRAGAAGVIAGLIADGETTITDIHHIERGYEHFVDRLRGLGADLERR